MGHKYCNGMRGEVCCDIQQARGNGALVHMCLNSFISNFTRVPLAIQVCPGVGVQLPGAAPRSTGHPPFRTPALPQARWSRGCHLRRDLGKGTERSRKEPCFSMFLSVALFFTTRLFASRVEPRGTLHKGPPQAPGALTLPFWRPASSPAQAAGKGRGGSGLCKEGVHAASPPQLDWLGETGPRRRDSAKAWCAADASRKAETTEN